MHFRILLFIYLMWLTSVGMAQSQLIATEQYFQDNPQSRSTFQYDAQGREVASKHYSGTANGTWGLHFSQERKYDNAGRQIFNSTSGWKYSDDSLYYHTEEQTIYNEAGKIANKILNSIYNIASPDEQKQKTEEIYEYNESGCLNSMTHRTYFEGGGVYEYTIQYENDNQCRPLKRSDGGFVTIWKYYPDNASSVYQYNINEGDSTLLTEIHYINNFPTEVIYRNQERITYTYNAQSSILERKRFLWETTAWVLKEQVTYTYNGSNQKITEETIVWIDPLSSPPLLYQSNTIYEYNDMGNVKYMESEYTNIDGSTANVGTSISFRCDGQPLTWVSTDMKTNKDYAKIFYYYSSPAACEGSATSISLFPNPTTRFLKINTLEQLQNVTLKIYNTAGQLLSEIPDTKNMTPIEVDINHLIPGTYLLKVESNSGVFSERFVKQ